MSASPQLKWSCHFGPFFLDLRTGELTRNGQIIRLQERPRSLLLALAERPGELVTRADLHEKLWPDDTIVDFENGLNNAISKLREALGEDSLSPHFIETVRRRGYRFIGCNFDSAEPREELRQTAESAWSSSGSDQVSNLPPVSVAPHQQAITTRPRAKKTLALIFAGVVSATAIVTAWWLFPLPAPRLIRVAQLTTDTKIDFLVKPVTDGARIFYLERAGGHWNSMETSLDGGDPQPVPGVPPNMRVMDISPDHATYLLGNFASRGSDAALWLMPIQGGPAVRLGNIISGDAVFHPDGRHIVFAKGKALWAVNVDGTDAHLFTTLPGGPFWLSWSPDGNHLRLTLADEDSRVTLWEINRDGSHLHRVLAIASGEQQCCGEWTPDGRYFIFTVTHGAISNLWASREAGFHLRRAAERPIQITDLPTGAWGAHIAPDGKSVLFYAGRTQSQIERIDAKTGEMTPVTPEGFVEPDYSPDGRWIATVNLDTGTLWKATADFTQRIPLSLAGFGAVFPRWSPNGSMLALSLAPRGQPTNIYLISATGGTPELLLPGTTRVTDADWAPDGERLVVLHPDGGAGKGALSVVDLATRKEEMIPFSEGHYFPHWSHDGRFLEAYADHGRAVDLFEFSTGRWERILRGDGLGFPVWSHDNRYLYFQRTVEENEPIYRLDMRSRAVERVADCRTGLIDGAARCTLMGLAPDDAPLVEVNRGNRDLFRADLNLP
ncbi:MAG TPA: winged helix-turn-helix domain-containing protein [Terracidiphilus sp.]|nr:winged helix-turn-helix domain-containing protein [Terracidiphilus sp.]